ncbi:MAG: hypothetical protein J7545_12145 [Roseofilum sp. SBFL]|uniref:hypothetical protein n=1 Tax=unclassified Roseofilum TaxID=2620099 RepID=UPI001B206F79|nr:MULTISPECIES: hypothetical protein [unclassified Roseofilum]MBP0012342.1 hypothetical protein [Roseofilum sp. SID3]MBP0022645.1 hypothetical protein [Roseofilum sp. SID2]MBP0036656.1 hypothetical protein [Roseofilum sp. SID1]MBP0042713.1 hypothetical protein [Roseofilum sp. SBFL]
MFWPIALFAIIVFLWTQETLVEKPKKKKTPEEKLGEAISEYLKSGIRIRTEESQDK